MKNYLLKFFAVLFLLISVLLFGQITAPIRSTTESLSKQITLKEGKQINFKTAYSYPHYLDLVLIDSLKESRFGKIYFKFSKNGETKFYKKEISLAFNSFTRIMNFYGDKGDDFSLVFLKLDEKFKNKSVRIEVDVSGGGPSVGLAFEREFRPTLIRIFYFSISFFGILLSIIVFKYFKNKKTETNLF